VNWQTRLHSLLVLLGVVVSLVVLHGVEGAGRRNRDVVQIVSDFLASLPEMGLDNELVDNFVKELNGSFGLIQKTSEFAKSLDNDKIIRSINVFIGLVPSTLEETCRRMLEGLPAEDRLDAEDIKALLEEYQKTLTRKIKEDREFPTVISGQLNAVFPVLIDVAVESYGNISSATGFRVSNGMLISFVGLLQYLKLEQYINRSMIKGMVDFPDQLRQNLNEAVYQFVQPEQLDMFLMMAKTFLASSAGSSARSKGTRKRQTVESDHEDL